MLMLMIRFLLVIIKMPGVAITKSLIAGLHITKKSSDPAIPLTVIPDHSRRTYDTNCFKVTCPDIESIPNRHFYEYLPENVNFVEKYLLKREYFNLLLSKECNNF